VVRQLVLRMDPVIGFLFLRERVQCRSQRCHKTFSVYVCDNFIV
jgi:hypothetical protein